MRPSKPPKKLASSLKPQRKPLWWYEAVPYGQLVLMCHCCGEKIRWVRAKLHGPRWTQLLSHYEDRLDAWRVPVLN